MKHQGEDETQLADYEADPPIEPLPPQPGQGVLGKGVTAAVATLLAGAYPPGAVLIAGASAAVDEIGNHLRRIQQETSSVVLSSASAASGLPLEEMLRRILARNDLTLIAAEILDAARRTTLAGKPSILGKSLGAILRDDALIDPEGIWIRLIGRVEPAHLRVLSLLFQTDVPLAEGSASWRPGGPRTIHDVGRSLGLGGTAFPLIQDLLQCGFLALDGIDGGSPEGSDAFDQRVVATALGAELLERLSYAGAES